MSWLDLPREPEPEVMDDSGEVEAYSSAAAHAHLGKIDDTLVEQAARLVRGRQAGRALDIGTGPGQIVLKLARRLPGWTLIGVDRSPNMIAQAHKEAEKGRVARAAFFVADGNRLAFPDASFDLIVCNSVLHHLAEPQRLFAEVARLAMPGAAILIRDLRRPSRVAYPLHVRWHGRYYSGTMYELFRASVRAAYTAKELEDLFSRSPLGSSGFGVRVFTHASTHLGLERPLH